MPRGYKIKTETSEDQISRVSADESLNRLIAGNERFIQGRSTGLISYLHSIEKLSLGQKPFATILGCSDSRVPPEFIFDTGLGELFVIRVAGNVFSSEVAGTLQYAGAYLGTPLFVVLGHTGCGAVQAALENIENKTEYLSRIQSLVNTIAPAVCDIDPKLSARKRLDIATERNVRWTVGQILNTQEGRARLAEGKFKIVGAIYEIKTGRVRILSE